MLRPMCGRYNLTTPPDAMRRLFHFLGNLPNLPPRYNIAPTDSVLAVRFNPQDGQLRWSRWFGQVPGENRLRLVAG